MDPRLYPCQMSHLPQEDGGGWLVKFPDVPGCVGTGDTPEEALHDGWEALQACLEVMAEEGRKSPMPGEGGPHSGKFHLRTPKSLHNKLAARAAREGVSMNTLAVALLAEGLGKRQVAGSE